MMVLMIQSKLANALSHLQRSLNAPEVSDFQQLEQEFGELNVQLSNWITTTRPPEL